MYSFGCGSKVRGDWAGRCVISLASGREVQHARCARVWRMTPSGNHPRYILTLFSRKSHRRWQVTGGLVDTARCARHAVQKRAFLFTLTLAGNCAPKAVQKNNTLVKRVFKVPRERPKAEMMATSQQYQSRASSIGGENLPREQRWFQIHASETSIS